MQVPVCAIIEYGVLPVEFLTKRAGYHCILYPPDATELLSLEIQHISGIYQVEHFAGLKRHRSHYANTSLPGFPFLVVTRITPVAARVP